MLIILNLESIIAQYFILRIYGHYMVSTEDSVLVTGGFLTTTSRTYDVTSAVVEFKDGNWNIIGNLAHSRGYHRAIKFGSEIMILGGNNNFLFGRVAT